MTPIKHRSRRGKAKAAEEHEKLQSEVLFFSFLLFLVTSDYNPGVSRTDAVVRKNSTAQVVE
jgi:hypothetical protein